MLQFSFIFRYQNPWHCLPTSSFISASSLSIIKSWCHSNYVFTPVLTSVLYVFLTSSDNHLIPVMHDVQHVMYPSLFIRTGKNWRFLMTQQFSFPTTNVSLLTISLSTGLSFLTVFSSSSVTHSHRPPLHTTLITDFFTQFYLYIYFFY